MKLRPKLFWPLTAIFVYARAAGSLASLDTGESLDEIVVTAGSRSVALASPPQSVTVLEAANYPYHSFLDREDLRQVGITVNCQLHSGGG